MMKFIKTSNISWLYLLIGLTLIFTFTGCANQATPVDETPSLEPLETLAPSETPIMEQAQPTPTDALPEIEVDPNDLDGISIRFVHPWSGAAGEVFQDIAMKFSLSNSWGIWVDVESQGNEEVLIAEVLSDLEKGDLPGLIAVHPYALGWLDMVQLNNYFNHPEFGMGEDEREDIPAGFLDPFTVDDKLTALPVAPQAVVLFYNQTWAEALGFVSYPEDEDAFTAQSCAGTAANLADDDPENDYTGGWLMNFDPAVLLSWYTAFGGEIHEGEMLQFNTDAGRSAFGYLEELYSPAKGCIWVGRQPVPYQYFSDHYALMYAGTLDQIPLQMRWLEQFENKDQWTVMGFPGLDGEVVMVDSPGLFIMENTPEEQLASWLFAKHLLSPEIQAQLVQSMFTLPVRNSAMAYLEDFVTTYPQWGSAYNRLGQAQHLPVSDTWGYGRWVLQDGINRLFAIEEAQVGDILEQVDDMIQSLEGTAQ
ncbi:MAG: extracellular solute-binding protein [Brevefilum sp.]|nr:extracellular solute-binding protein [Brevefilum sp.]MDT8381507.1 extracellular solute-binding protein [Brevefilum sp.]MDW7755855.1 extracellular solute-binding protein [Brevefilum sp.]